MNLSEEYESEVFGTLGDDTFRVFFKKKLPNVVESQAVYISPFHDIPLYSEAAPNIHRMVVRMPRWTSARMEISKNEPFNPIKHDSTRQRLRYYDNIFPYHGVLWNYGSFPQTWEMMSFMNPDFENLKSDNSPLDVIEIGSRVHKIGTVIDVKILGALVLIDQDHLDWKIVAIDINDHLASKIDNITDVEKYMPGLLNATLEYFRFYKVVLGHPPIVFGYNKTYLDKSVALQAIERSHKFWKNLIKAEVYFKHSKDSADFKLFNTQCLDGNSEYIRNSKEAEDVISNLKLLITERPVESMAEKPSAEQIERVIYLHKSNFENPVQELKSTKIDEKSVEAAYDSLGTLVQKNFFLIVLPICALGAGIFYSIKKSKI